MADRKAKQLAFEQKRLEKQNVEIDKQRALLIYTSSCDYEPRPDGLDHVFDLSEVSMGTTISLSRTALELEIKEMVMSIPKFKSLLKAYLKKIEAKDMTSILITCHHGRHRSVAMAESIKDAYPLAKCIHLMLG